MPGPRRSLMSLRLADRAALGFAAVVIVLAAASSNEPSTADTVRDLDVWAMVLFVAALAVTVVSRRLPGTAAIVVLVLGFVWYGVGYTSGLINVATLIAFYRLGASEAARAKVAVTASAVVAVLVNIGVVAGEAWSEALMAAGYIIVAVLFGELVRHRHLLLEQYAHRAEQAEADAERRVAEERLRIARDLHDVLAHTVSVMIVQAGVATDRLERDPRAARDALGAIRESGRQAVGEVKAAVAVLRAGADDEGALVTAPAPRIDRLSDLVEATRGHGLRVDLDTVLSGRALPELVELTVYRVVQESLTNVVRHAGASSVAVAIREERSRVMVEVRDDGTTDGGQSAAGFGLRGMAERVESIGGELWHGRDVAGGWTVRAWLPLVGGAA
ncbi:MAG: sensor histidine kinase [Acidimicrobiales bacterium]